MSVHAATAMARVFGSRPGHNGWSLARLGFHRCGCARLASAGWTRCFTSIWPWLVSTQPLRWKNVCTRFGAMYWRYTLYLHEFGMRWQWMPVGGYRECRRLPPYFFYKKFINCILTWLFINNVCLLFSIFNFLCIFFKLFTVFDNSLSCKKKSIFLCLPVNANA